MIDNLEARLRRIAIYCSNCAQTHELLVIFEVSADIYNLTRRYFDSQFAAIELPAGDCSVIVSFKRRRDGPVS
jgi:hypothetical protein